LDRSFDADGKQVIDFGGYDRATSMVIQPDDKIVLAGYTDDGSTFDFAVARLNKDGSPDASFGDEGKQIIDFRASNDGAYDVVVQQDGEIVVVGWSDEPESGSDFALARLLGEANKKSSKVSTSAGKSEGESGRDDALIAAAIDQFFDRNSDAPDADAGGKLRLARRPR
jgi:uncharacterized delta-60 repeat protein